MPVDATGFPPRLFLIGAQKAGTTSLAFLLNQHPDIAVSDPKEPGFFGPHFGRGWDWYRGCFPQTLPRVLLDASTGYTMAALLDGEDARVPQRIKASAPDARFIYVLRDPVERTISAYWHDKRAGRPIGSLREAVDAEPFYADVSRYHWQISLYLEHFPRGQFLFVNFAELTADPVGIAKRCIAFAGLDPALATLNLGEPKNAAFQFNGLGRRFFSLFPDERTASQFVNTVKRATPSAVHRLVKEMLTSATDAIAPADRAWLANLFTEENQKMEALTGFRFDR
jgi:hypothetical protein